MRSFQFALMSSGAREVESPTNLRGNEIPYPLLSFVWSGLFLAMFLTPLILVVTWFHEINSYSPDVPDPSWTDLITVPFVFCCKFPASFLFQGYSINLIWGSIFNSVFWSFLCTALHRVFVRGRKEAFHKTGAKRLLNALAIVAVILLFYVLSVGPVNWVWIRFERYEPKAATAIAYALYSPLGRLYASDSVGGRIYKRYLDFWVELAKPGSQVEPSPVEARR